MTLPRTGMITDLMDAIGYKHFKPTNIAVNVAKNNNSNSSFKIFESFTKNAASVNSSLGIEMNFSSVNLDFPIRRQ